MKTERNRFISSIPGYRIHNEIYESQHSIAYRGVREQDGSPVVIKMLKDQYPPPMQLARYQREYEIASLLKDKPGIIKVFDLTRCESTLALITEDFGAYSLKHLLAQRSFSLEETLSIGSQIASGLHEIHSAKIIHNDLNPANILYNPRTREVKLIDFGISSLVPREEPDFDSPGHFEGTLAYISPEQTGRTNHAVDFRSDFYSFGVTLYQLLTGTLPFDSDDPKQLIFQHIFVDPIAPHLRKTEIPGMVSNLVMKLMAKAPEQRYQTALGLAADLEHCLEQNQQIGSIGPFELGRLDMSINLLVPQRLYGREEEVRTLLESFERVTQGTSEVVLVSGYSGIGKTSLVRQLFPPLTQREGYFISGKFDQHQRGRPYSAFLDAFAQLVRQLVTEPDEQVAEWRSRLLQVLGSNGRVLTELIPELTQIIGPQPEVSELSPTERQNRFNLIFQRFLGVFGQEEHPLVLFIDDLQWADLSSLRLLKLCLSSIEPQCLLLLGAYRDNEVSAGHPLLVTLEQLRQSSCRSVQIRLSPLKIEHVNELLADTLRSSQEQTLPLAELLHARTDGNPFFLQEFLRSLYSDGLLTADVKERRWRFDLARIRERGVSENVVELMVRKISRLSAGAQEALKRVACFGVQVEFEDYSLVVGGSREEGRRELEESVSAGLLLPLKSNGKEQSSLAYRFVHDRVQQAAYSLMEAEEKKQTHFQIGTRLKQTHPPEQDDRRIFDLVSHLNQARTRLPGQEERDDLARLNLLAGKKAKGAAAYAQAAVFLDIARELIGRDAWEKHYTQTLSLHDEAAEATYLSNEFSKMDQYIEDVLLHAKSHLDKKTCIGIRIEALAAQARLRDSIQTGLTYLNQLGFSLPASVNKLHILVCLLRTKICLLGKTTDSLTALPRMTDPLSSTAIHIMRKLAIVAYMCDAKLLALMTLTQVRLVVRHGYTPWAGSIFSSYAMILCGVLEDIETGYEMGNIALLLVEKNQVKKQMARVTCMVHAFVRHYKDELKTTIEPLREAYRIGLETGDLAYGGIGAFQSGQHSFFSGHSLAPLEKELKWIDDALILTGQRSLQLMNSVFLQIVTDLRCGGSKPWDGIGQIFTRAMFDETISANHKSCLFGYYLQQAMNNCHFLRYEEATISADLAFGFIASVIGYFGASRLYAFHSLAYLGRAKSLHPRKRRRDLARVNKNQQKLRKLAHFAPMNHLHMYLLVEGETCNLNGRFAKAEDYYQRAIHLARVNEFQHEEALANELAGKFYLERKEEEKAVSHLMAAMLCYVKWGARAKVDQMDEMYGALLVK